MGLGGSPSVPAVTVPPPIPAVQSPQGAQAATTAATRATNAIGPQAMIDTGPNGLTSPASTGTKTLLGS
ncbi:hypothetical protein SAMN05444165_4117 [Paraburkholderia phenazinium]|jgi:hypothetical protein|uniref:Uncharacterized protein n=1 Tax=Paraburkholderia phenazinium TaxID=60549 RepID=A0A1N6KPA7_9BURK|nr:hypothetical protein SAMN05444165_4117 [Paraburkholderia phenazinium]